jgi:hypothetical protein
MCARRAFHNLYPAFDDENNLSMALVLTINGVEFFREILKRLDGRTY